MSFDFHLLTSSNLDEKEALIYKMCLQHGKQTATELAESTGIKRPTVYTIVERMITKGFLMEDASEVTKKFIAASPQEVLQLLKHRKKSFDQHIAQWETYMPELEAIAKKDFQAPQVRFFRGPESMTRIYEEALKQNIWRGIVNPEEIVDNFEEYLWKIGETLVKNNTDAKDIVVDCEIGRAYQQKFHGNNCQIKLISPDIPIMSDTIIVEDQLFLLSFDEHEMLVLDIKSNAVVRSQLLMFDALWDSLP